MSEKELEELLERAKAIKMTNTEKEEQRRSFAYGNANIENAAVTKRVVDQAAAEIEKKRAGSGG